MRTFITFRMLFATMMAAGFAPLAAPVRSEDVSNLKSVSVDLPAGDGLFPGGGSADAVNNNCLACHSTEMVLNQPVFPKAVWEAEVQKMIKTYKAPIDLSDTAAIVAYLVKIKGKS